MANQSTRLFLVFFQLFTTEPLFGGFQTDPSEEDLGALALQQDFPSGSFQEPEVEVGVGQSEWEELEQEGRMMIDNALAPSTKKRYQAAFDIWVNFCNEFDLPVLDVSMEKVCGVHLL